jgi:hypothetical protein
MFLKIGLDMRFTLSESHVLLVRHHCSVSDKPTKRWNTIILFYTFFNQYQHFLWYFVVLVTRVLNKTFFIMDY